MKTNRDAEIDRNFDFFQSVVSNLLKDHAGQHAILRGQNIVSFHPSSVAALTAAYEKFPDGLFSVQEVTVTPLDLGFYSHVASIGKDRQ